MGTQLTNTTDVRNEIISEVYDAVAAASSYPRSNLRGYFRLGSPTASQGGLGMPPEVIASLCGWLQNHISYNGKHVDLSDVDGTYTVAKLISTSLEQLDLGQ